MLVVLFVDSDGNSFSSGACGLGWYGTQAGAQAKETIERVAKPCHILNHFFKVAAEVDDGGGPPSVGPGGVLKPSQRIPLPPIQKVVGGYYHSFAISKTGLVCCSEYIYTSNQSC